MFPKKKETKDKIDTSGLMFPKSVKRKKLRKKRTPKSVLQEKDGRCFLCMMLHNDYRYHNYLERHHVFNGPDRDASEEEGLTVYLCVNHHREGPEAVQNNQDNNRIVQCYAQEFWEQNHTREEFQKKFRGSYL